MKRKNSIISITLATLLLVSLCTVCASTSVSAAGGTSSATVRPPTALVGNPLPAGTGPSLVISGNYLYSFVQGYDGALWTNREDLVTQGLPNWGWSGWGSLGGQLTSSPCAVAQSSGVIDVYVTGTNGAVYQKQYDNGWQSWTSLGGQVAPGTGPGACSWSSGRLDVFVEGTNGNMYHKWYTGGWSGWENLYGQLTSSPGAVSRQSGVIDVYVRGTNGAVYEKSFSGGWSGWYNLGGVLAPGTGPAACVWQAFVDREDVFVTGTDGGMYQKTWTAGSGWTTTWTDIGGDLNSSPGVASPSGPLAYAITIFARFNDGNLYSIECFSGQWWGWRGPGDGPP